MARYHHGEPKPLLCSHLLHLSERVIRGFDCSQVSLGITGILSITYSRLFLLLLPFFLHFFSFFLVPPVLHLALSTIPSSVLLSFVEQLMTSGRLNVASDTTTTTLVDGNLSTPIHEDAGSADDIARVKRIVRRMRMQIWAGAFSGFIVALSIGAAFIAVVSHLLACDPPFLSHLTELLNSTVLY